MSEELKPCPFCGGKPRVDLDKITYWQLHGEPSKTVRVYCYRSDCAAKPSVSAGDVYNGGEAAARRVAIAAWNRRAPSLDMREAVEALEKSREVLRNAIANKRFGDAGPLYSHAVAALHMATTALRSLTGAKP